jgi:aryl-alcohol dehydrogenase-like predicted oxidoreductase
MRYNKLGHTDLNVSVVCLGTMTWGQQNTQAEGHEQMDYALDQGVNFWDTAELYSVPPSAETYGRTEEIIGTWFEKTGRRSEVILASKIAPIACPGCVRTCMTVKPAWTVNRSWKPVTPV